MRSAAAFFFVVLLAACGRDTVTPYEGDPTAPTLDPGTRTDAPATTAAALREGPYCKPDAAGIYSSTLPTGIDQTGNTGDRFWALGGGCIARPLRDVWAATHGQGIANWSESDLVFYKPGTDTRVDFSFQSQHEAGPNLPFVGRTKWWMDWFQTLTQGDKTDPAYVVVKYVKSKGTHHIKFWEGSFELKALDAHTTSFVMRNEIEGTRCDLKKATGAVTDTYQRLKTLPPEWKYLSR